MNDDSFEFYANSVNVITSVYDVTLTFRTQSPVSMPEEDRPAMIEVTGTCNVRMSPQHAKSLAALLVKHIADYESKHDLALPVPPDIQQFWNDCVEKGSEQ